MEVIGRILRAERLASGPIKNVLGRYGLDRGGFDVLERAGLVERVSGQPDRRSTPVGLTAAGAAVIDAAMTAHMACEQAMLTSLSDAERRSLAALLRKLLTGLEEADG